MIRVPRKTVYGELGETVTIDCLVEAFPKGHHYWEGVDGKRWEKKRS